MKHTPMKRAAGPTRKAPPARRAPPHRTATSRTLPPGKPAALLDAEALVDRRAGGRCERCGHRPDWRGAQHHHRQPRQMGGTRGDTIHSPANLLLLCANCHDWVESTRAAAYEQGYLVHRGQDPAETPVLRPDGGTVHLDHDGGMSAWLPPTGPLPRSEGTR